ncbi:hypothetical protein HZH66_005402 [Vespula vulgaris]|uniref:C2H2-type domain-containing protein n=1 Tax=Vespula vulgaris TaxID=7454 RepID=A0A834KAU9_VESVU|nr:uncharacterized protein LOC127063518 [Vespula vulgaris]KAF7403135.1 hypothetical protein HZH66_005402 [Vespula vulgaris]
MAQISNSNVFTNDATSSTSTSDLLQQAFQQVVDDDDNESDFVAFLQNDENDSQTIHLTSEQAAALGLTFEINSNEEVIYQQNQDSVIPNTTKITSNDNCKTEDVSSVSPQDTFTDEDFNFETAQVQNDDGINDIVKSECMDYSEWQMQEDSPNEKLQNETVANSLTLGNICLPNQTINSQSQTLEVKNNPIQINSNTQRIVLEQPKVHAIMTDIRHIKTEDNSHYMVEDNLAQNQPMNNVSSSQAQILQKLPILLPSSQFIIKPAQTILKPAKNVKLIQNINKLANTNLNSINGMQSINMNSNSNSVLLSKATVINTLSPQIIKATPITAQLLNTNNVSAQLLNTSHIITGSCEIGNHTNAPQITNTVVNSTPVLPQNITTSQIRISPAIKTTQSSLQKGNISQLLTPMLKNATTITKTVPKTAQLINNTNISPAISTELKPVQVPTQIIKASSSVMGKKNLVTPVTKIITQTNSPVIFRTASIVKTQDSKTTMTNSTSILKPTQSSSTPISILKPQTKVAFHNYTKQNQTVTLNTNNLTTNIPNLSQTTPVIQQNGSSDKTKSFQNGIFKQKINSSMNGACLKINKKSKGIPTRSTTIVSEAADTSKPLGSSENPIQIVQQGHHFHSIQRLSPTQLKQIAHVLQQRSQETSISNERIVYRVVFPEELDLRLKNPGTLIKNRGGKRGRPKKNTIRPSLIPSKTTVVPEEEQVELKDDRKKVIARTRSGRLSRPPRHMVRDYKHLHHSDFLQPDLDDSDGGYSDYNTNNDKIEDEESPKELLTGLEVPKRKISDHFRCPTCSKIYLGRTRMARHFEMHPDHGSPEQLPPPTPDPELKQNGNQDPLKRKGKKRGPWAYVTPEAKSERRKVKLKEAISVCEDIEIIKIAAKPVLNAQSLYDLLVLKSENNVRNFLQEVKQLMDKIREKVGEMLSLADTDKGSDKDLVDINEELLCDALGVNPGLYKINNDALKSYDEETSNIYINEEPPVKLRKTANSEESKENNEERMSSGFSESSDLSISDFLSERRTDAASNPTCPEVLSALTLMRRNPSNINNVDNNKATNVSKLLISSPEIQNQISENPGFQKIDINTTKVSKFQTSESHKESFTKLTDNLGPSSDPEIFGKVESNYDESKLEHIDEAFIKLGPVEQGLVKLENGTLGSFEKQSIQSDLNNIEDGSQTFAKGFQKLVSKIVPMSTSNLNCSKVQSSTLDANSCKILPAASICKASDSISVLQDAVPIISNNCDTNIFDSTENLDMSKVAQYDHITHLDILNSSSVIDKNLLIDEKLVEQLHLVDQTNLVDELVSERLKNIMPDNILEGNIIPNNTNLDTDLDFEALSEEFNRNARS